jgi:hypothetical protein
MYSWEELFVGAVVQADNTHRAVRIAEKRKFPVIGSLKTDSCKGIA